MEHTHTYKYPCAPDDISAAIVIDDLSYHRDLAARVLRRAGWAVHLAASCAAGEALAEQVLGGPDAMRTVILTDLRLPGDPTDVAGRQVPAGARLALRLCGRMERGELPYAPIVALTALNDIEDHEAALLCGCAAVLAKPVTPALPARIVAALAQAPGEDTVARRLRSWLAGATAPGRVPALTERDLYAALLAHRRRGPLGLGESALAEALAPQIASRVRRGEHVYYLLEGHLAELKRLGAPQAFEILHGELTGEASPERQQATLGLSRAEYYERRRAAALALLDLLGRGAG